MTSLQTRMRPIAAIYSDPLRLAALVLGSWWLSNLLVGWWIGHDFATSPVNGDRADVLFLPIVVNGWHLLVHGLTGILGLAAAAGQRSAAVYCVGMAFGYVAWGALGLTGAEVVTNTIAVDTFGSWVHIAEGTILATVVLLREQLRGPLTGFVGDLLTP